MKRLFIIIGFVVAIGIAFFVEAKYKQSSDKEINVGKFQKAFHNKERTVEAILGTVSEKIKETDNLEIISSLDKKLTKEDISIYIYESDSLVLWSNHSIPIDGIGLEELMGKKIIKFSNGWYGSKYLNIEGVTVVALFLIKQEYSYQNQFLINKYQKHFRFPAEIDIVIDGPESSYSIYDNAGEYCFSLLLPMQFSKNNWLLHLGNLFYMLGFALFMLFVYRMVGAMQSSRQKNRVLAVLVVVLPLIGLLLCKLNVPRLFYQSQLFDPKHFAIAKCISSLGDLSIHSMILVALSYFVFRELNISTEKVLKHKLFRKLVFLVFGTITIAYFVVVVEIFNALVFDSTISFEFFKILNVNRFSIFGFFVVTFLFGSFLLLLYKFISTFSGIYAFQGFLLRFSILMAALCCASVLLFGWTTAYNFVFLIFISLFVSYISFFRNHFTITHQTLVVLILSLYSLIFIELSTNVKIKNESKVIAVNLANERDQIVEFLLETVSTGIKADTFVTNILSNGQYDEVELENYFSQKYFSGYFRRFDVQLSICRPNEDLTIEYEFSEEVVPCFAFFYNMIENDGIKIPNTDFYFLDNINGKISYIGVISFMSNEFGDEITIFVSLDSKLATERLGYPELLLEGTFAQPKYLKNFSYAKYFGNQLITQSGTYLYSYENQFVQHPTKQPEFEHVVKNNFKHWVYQPDLDNTIVISYQRTGIFNIILAFTYIFVINYLILMVLSLFYRPRHIRSSINNDFKNRIKYSIISVVLLSFVFTGIGTIFYSVRQFENKHSEELSEKIQSVLIELEHKIGFEEFIDESFSEYLTTLLVKFSDVFYTDINLYDTNGKLLASSIPDVFDRGLIGKRMNLEAYRQIIVNHEARFVHKEKIGKHDYISAYEPLKNIHNQILAYLNLPYFTQQSDLRNEIYTLVAAILNIFIILILISILIAVFVSNQITRPLKLIQMKISEISLKKGNEQINYRSNDEIGNLIKDYNRMVVELGESADKLAKTEREIAWREMAKQIAHEIKNPLTPMKLSVQHLQRAWDDKVEKWDDLLKRTSKTLIDQIDHLSLIATEFSNFAKMPKAKYEVVDLILKLRHSVSLFNNYENVAIELNLNRLGNVFVFADKEQLLRVYSNLIKNSIQSIPAGRKGIIRIDLSTEGDNAIVKVMDNGKGILDDLKEKLFEPNFTTKTSGMGLGLAITKNIIESIGGKIWYETEMEKGSTFFVSIPLYFQE